LTTGDVPARVQMGATLGFHIILACIGIALPTIMLLAEYIGLRHSNPVAMLLARRWSQALGVLVAVGAVTGTVLSFEMGLSVVAVNSWMNQPGGFQLVDGRVAQVEPWQVFFNHASAYETPHMILAAYMVSGFLAAPIYAVGFLRGRRDRYHRTGFAIPFAVAACVTPVQLLISDTAARAIAADQPVKFAAMEYVSTTSTHVAEYLGGIYYNGRVYDGLRVRDMDSLLVEFSPGSRVIGLDSVPASLRPPSATSIHLAFDAMVGLGTLMLLAGLWALLVYWRRREQPPAWCRW
jgi:cytochrome d ubiquinol oxidase subunit I